MTAEIAILNKQGLAIAADSAITASRPSGDKIFTSANKIFALSKFHPVCVMVYGNAAFMGVPWETIVKVYRKALGARAFRRLHEYALHFLSFLRTDQLLVTAKAQEAYVRGAIFSYLAYMKKELDSSLRSKIEKGPIGRLTVRKAVADVIDSHHKRWIHAPLFAGLAKDTVRKMRDRCAPIVEEAQRKTFEDLPISKQRRGKLLDIAVALFVRRPPGIRNQSVSGVVFAGFGEDDTFPSLSSYLVQGVVDQVLQAELDREASIGDDLGAFIAPFAQGEMVALFMEGVNPDYQKAIEKDLADIVQGLPGIVVDSLTNVNEEGKKALKTRIGPIAQGVLRQYIDKLKQYRHDTFVNPVVAAVAMLPKDELATMAESLVSLTSFKRRFSMESETVGGPTDVAVISKGDGFVWIKQKHYFKLELNPHFSANYFREAGHEDRASEQ